MLRATQDAAVTATAVRDDELDAQLAARQEYSRLEDRKAVRGFFNTMQYACAAGLVILAFGVVAVWIMRENVKVEKAKLENEREKIQNDRMRLLDTRSGTVWIGEFQPQFLLPPPRHDPYANRTYTDLNAVEQADYADVVEYDEPEAAAPNPLTELASRLEEYFQPDSGRSLEMILPSDDALGNMSASKWQAAVYALAQAGAIQKGDRGRWQVSRMFYSIGHLAVALADGNIPYPTQRRAR